MTPSQRALWRTLHGGQAPNRLPKGEEYRESVLILGGRSGKDTMIGAITAYEACTGNWHSYIRPGEWAWAFVFATTEKQAIEIGRNVIFGNIRASPILKQMVIENPDETATKTFPKSKAGCMLLHTGACITALPCSSNAGRGYPIFLVILDEIAFFAREAKDNNTDANIYRSVLPRTIQFGERAKTFLISTPGDKTGLLWDKYNKRDDHRKDYYCLRCPTWKIRTDIPKEDYMSLYRRDPVGFMEEMGAQFHDSLEPLIPKKKLVKCLREDEEPIPPHPDKAYALAIDAAFKDRDRFSLAVGHIEEGDGTYEIVIDIAEIIVPTMDEDVHDAAVRRITEVYEAYDGWEVVADDYQADAFAKTLEGKGVNLNVKSWTAGRHRSAYGKLRGCIMRGMISLPNNSDMIEEILGLKVKFLPSGQYTVGHRVGGNDDIADSVASVVETLYIEDATDASVEFV